MIADAVVQEADPAPLAFAFRQMGGFNGEVTVSVIDADGITHVPSRDDMRHPDTGFLLEVQVRLDPGWAYPARVMVDWAEEHRVSSKERTPMSEQFRRPQPDQERRADRMTPIEIVQDIDQDTVFYEQLSPMRAKPESAGPVRPDEEPT